MCKSFTADRLVKVALLALYILILASALSAAPPQVIIEKTNVAYAGDQYDASGGPLLCFSDACP